jgi:hypothetical protein
MRFFFLFVGLLLACAPMQAQQLSPDAQISLLTYSPVAEIHTVFGHSAVRVTDPVQQLDVVFNYGTFDYDAPNFTLNFIRGKLNYSLSIQRFQDVLQSCIARNQTLSEQVLALDSLEKQAFFNFLATNYQPENRYYLYDFFFDNCATRIRDGIDTVLHVEYDRQPTTRQLSFRRLLHEFTAPQPWLNFGIDLVLGLPADRVANFEERKFLPKYLKDGAALAFLRHNGSLSPLVQTERTLTKALEMPPRGFQITPLFLFWALYFLTLALNLLKKDLRLTQLWNSFFLFVFGAAGVVMLAMWFGTDHPPTKNNLNILWAFPLHLVAAFWLSPNKTHRFVKIYFLFFTLSNTLILISSSFFPQRLHPAFLPILLTLIVITARASKLNLGRGYSGRGYSGRK